MGKTRYLPPAGKNFHLARLLQAMSTGADSYEASVCELQLQRNVETDRQSGAVFLPDATLTRDLGIGTAADGGDLAAPNGLAAVAAAARPQLVLDRIGCRRLEVVSTGPISMPRWTRSTGGWVQEFGAAAVLNSQVESVTASGRMAAARIGVSRKMLLMAEAIEPALLAEVERSVADVLEGGFISGSGANSQPHGLIHQGGGSVTFGAATPTHPELLDMLEAYGDADGDLARAVWLLHPSDMADLMKASVAAGSGETVLQWADGAHRIAGLPVHPTRHVSEGKVLLLDPQAVTQVYWGSPQLISDRFSSGKSLSGALELVVLSLADVAVLNPAHVVVGSA
jgi:HK97 family phage major capsid protein